MPMGKQRTQQYSDHDSCQEKSKTQNPIKLKKKKNPIKVTYISSPMMVKASSAAEFRAIVQELTGRDSDIRKDHHGIYHDGSAGVLMNSTDKADREVHCSYKVDPSSSAAAEADYSEAGGDALLNRLSSLEFEQEGYLWRGLEHMFGVLQSPCIFV